MKTQAEIQTFLTEKIAAALRATPTDIDPNKPLSNYGLDSLDAMTIMGQLSEACGLDIDFDVIWDYPSIAAVSEYVANELAQ